MIKLDTLAILFGALTPASAEIVKNESLIDPTLADIGVIIGAVIGIAGVAAKFYQISGERLARTRELDLRERELIFKENGHKK